jgi:DNA-binding transcriptional regulator YiaG
MMPSDDSKIPAERITFEGRPQLRADRAGYVLDGEHVEGFADRPDLDPQGRRTIAEWAKAFTPDRLQDEQKRLLEQHDPGLSDTERQLLKGAIENAERDMPLAIDLGLYARLDAEQIRAIREPWTVLAGARRREYPLNTSELARLTGTTAKQIRTWEESGLLPAYWIAGRRHFFSAAGVYAFALRELDRNEIRGARRVLSAEPEDPIPELVAAALKRSRYSATPPRLTHLLVAGRPAAGLPIFVPHGQMPQAADNDRLREFHPSQLGGVAMLVGGPMHGSLERLVTEHREITPRPNVTFRHIRRETLHTWSCSPRKADDLPALRDLSIFGKAAMTSGCAPTSRSGRA